MFMQPRKTKMRRILIIATIVLAIVAIIISAIVVIKNLSHVKTVSGTVTLVAPDCGNKRYFVDGEVVEDNAPAVCDGGDYIVVSGVRIQTSSGMVSKGAYDNSVNNIRPGDTVTVTYYSDDNGDNHTNCPTCGIQINNRH